MTSRTHWGRLWTIRTPLCRLRTPLGRLRTPLGRLRTPLGRLRTPLGRLRTPLGRLRTSRTHLGRPRLGVCRSPGVCRSSAGRSGLTWVYSDEQDPVGTSDDSFGSSQEPKCRLERQQPDPKLTKPHTVKMRGGGDSPPVTQKTTASQTVGPT